jgi:hypothetical protein
MRPREIRSLGLIRWAARYGLRLDARVDRFLSLGGVGVRRSGGIGRRARFRTWFPLRECRFKSCLRHFEALGVTANGRAPFSLRAPVWGAFGGQCWGCVGVVSLVRGTVRRYDFLEGNPVDWLETHPTSGHFKICFRWGGRKLKKTVKTTGQREAESALVRFEENLRLLEPGRLDLPAGADIGTFLLSDGKLSSKPNPASPALPMTLGELRDAYVAVHANGAMEAISLDTVRMHLRHAVATLGNAFQIERLDAARLQRHIDRHAKALPGTAAECRDVAQGSGRPSRLLELWIAIRAPKGTISRPEAHVRCRRSFDTRRIP